jgi:hypothetical protein
VSMAPGAVPPMPPNMPPNLPPIGAAGTPTHRTHAHVSPHTHTLGSLTSVPTGGPSSPGGMRPMSTFSPQPPRVSPSPEVPSPSLSHWQPTNLALMVFFFF